MSPFWTRFCKHPLTRFLSSLKLAVIVIVGSILAMAVGTITESLYGREFAKRLVYDSVIFWGIFSLLFLNVLFAALVRLPPKQRLAGFYFIHLGILLLLAGGTMTYCWGIDGLLELRPQTPTNRVLLDEPVLSVSHMEDSHSEHHLIPLPETVREIRSTKPRLNTGNYEIYVDRFLPYAQFKERWVDAPANSRPARVYWVDIGNERFKETLKVGNVTGYTPDANAGALTLTLLPTEDSSSWLSTLRHSEASRFSTPHLFILNDTRLIYGKGSDWKVSDITLFSPITLPWMNLTLTPTRIIEDKVPEYDWELHWPETPEDRPPAAAFIRVVNRTTPTDTQTTWTNPAEEAHLTLDETRFNILIGKKIKPLDFSIMLDRFKMDTNPGTMTPASYESFVKVLSANGQSSDAHVYMNHPLKQGPYTLYQSSYFELPDGSGYGSVFSVNYDPGRATKYAGAFILVAGSILHYYIRRKQSV